MTLRKTAESSIKRLREGRGEFVRPSPLRLAAVRGSPQSSWPVLRTAGVDPRAAPLFNVAEAGFQQQSGVFSSRAQSALRSWS